MELFEDKTLPTAKDMAKRELLLYMIYKMNNVIKTEL